MKNQVIKRKMGDFDVFQRIEDRTGTGIERDKG